MTGPGVSVVIPVYGAREKLAVCLESLARHLPSGCAVHVRDDATPGNGIAELAASYRGRIESLHYARSASNHGFVATCNDALASLPPEHDVLLLNSDTEATEGFLEEMLAVLYAHERHGAVSPRSNNATIFSVPVHERVAPEQSFLLWQTLKPLLPRWHVAPTAVGFCMLVKRSVIKNFGFFDPLYSPGYNEENDFVCRINQYGYSAVSANHAFVYHHEASSFGSRRAELEKRNRARLSSRYPEYDRKVSEYFRFHLDPVEHFASLYLPHRPRFLFDLSHLPPKHSGTSEFGLKLLAHIGPLLERDCDLYAGVNADTGAFFRDELSGCRLFDESRERIPGFDLVYKPCQAFTWQELYRMNRLGARIAFTLQDIIGVRCDYLSAASRYYIVKSSVELADRTFAISAFSRSDFDAYFGVDSAMQVIHHGTEPERPSEIPPGSYVLVVGNAFRHKAVSDAVAELRRDWPLVVLGADAQKREGGSRIRWYASGLLSHQDIRQLFEKAMVVVYPSHYEGFGLPVLDALKYGKPVVAIDTQTNRELLSLCPGAPLHLAESFAGLGEAVARAASPAPGSGVVARTWDDAARDYYQSFAEMLAAPVSVDRLRRRWERLRLLRSVLDIG